jgi:HSP20 family protein
LKEELDMTYATWDLFREMETLRREVARAFEQSGHDEGRPAFRRTAFLPGTSARAYPLVNVGEDKNTLYVEALAPGIDPATLAISVVRDTLTVTGDKQPISADVKPEAFHRNERGSGKFTRTITLPIEVDGDKVSAQYKDGLLLITLPKSEAAKPKQITVKVA